MNLYSFSVLTFSAGVLLTALLAIVKRKDQVALRFLLFSISVCGWGFLFSFWITQNYSESISLLLVRVSYVFVVFIPITWLHFVLEFTGKREPVKYFYLVNYTIAFFFIALCPTPLLFKGMHPILDFKYVPTPASFHHLHIVIFFTLVPYGFWHLFHAYHLSFGQKRVQLKFLLTGTVVGFMAGGTIYLPFYKIPFPLILLSLMPLYPLLTGVALIRFGLFDAQQIADAFQRERLATIGTLATSINHEIRNPLYVIKGMAESHLENLKDGIYTSPEEVITKSSEILSTAIDQTQRAMEMMKRFALFAKEGTREEAQFEAVKLDETFKSILPLVRHELALDKIELYEEIPNDLPLIHADRRHIEEIFFNLIVNACQAMKDGGKLRVHAEQRNAGVQIEIEDGGPGIPPQQLSKIFEPFYTTKESGTGLGLYITKQLVERNKGRISVESKLGEGARFILKFPVKRS